MPIPLEGSYNARGVGEGVRPWLIRSAALDDATPQDEAALRALGADAVLDLREPAERRPPRHRFPVIAVPLYGAEPPRTGALEQIYAGLLNERGAALAAAVAQIADHPGTLIVHCTAGKDRTGLVVALARTAVGDSRETVLSDYAVSGETVRPARLAVVRAQLDSLALAGAHREEAARLHLDSPAEALAEALDLVDHRGGAARYLLDHGLTPAQLDALIVRVARGGMQA